MSNGFEVSGWARIGADVKSFFKVWNASSHSGLQMNLVFLCKREVIG